MAERDPETVTGTGRIAAARLLASIVESSGDAIVSLSLDGTVQSWNAAAERLFGYGAAEAVGRPIDLLLPPEAAEEERRIGERIGAGERVERFETTRVRRDGSCVPVSVTVSPIRDDAGRVIGVSEIMRDDSERREARRALERGEQHFRTLVEQVEDYAIFRIDPAGRAVTWNEGVRRVLGFDEEEWIGRDIATLIFNPEDVIAGVPEREMDTAAREGKSSNDRWMRRKSGRRFFAMGVTTALRDEPGTLLGFTKVMRDQTERVRLESEIREQAAALAEKHRRKDEFLAMLSHELRNPLAPISYAVELLRRQRGSGTPLEERARGIIERQVAQLSHLVDDLLEVTRISLGAVQIRQDRVALEDVVEHAVETVRERADERRHALEIALGSGSTWVRGDAARLEQVLVNLLVNAIKYTEEGGRITVEVGREADCAVARVRDTGVGIAPEFQHEIFDLFTQAERSLDRSAGGLGVGLSLVQRLVELHRGSVEVNSVLGRGSEFVVRLPLAAAPEEELEPPRASPESSARGLRVLVVDDSEDTADSMAMLLRAWRHDVRTAYDGPSALEVAREQEPHVVLLDIGLPRIDGYEVARRLRRDAALSGAVLVAMTGYGQDVDRRRSAEAGFDHHLVKPAAFEEVERILTGVAAGAEGSERRVDDR